MIPADAELTARHDEIPAWDDDARRPQAGARSPDGGVRRVHGAHRPPRRSPDRHARGTRCARRHARLLHHRRQRRQRRGHDQRHVQRAAACFNGAAAFETAESMASHIDEFGGPAAYNHYAVGWAHAMDTPYQWTKQVASHWGGTRNGTDRALAERLHGPGRDTHAVPHVIDVAPTVLDVAGLPGAELRERHPADADARRQHASYSFDDAGAAEQPRTQYFEMFCNRGIYHQGWTAVTRHSTPWVTGADAACVRRRRLGAVRRQTDWTQAHDIAAEQPGQAAELQRLFLIEAVKYSVLAARRSPGRALQLRHRRPARARQGQDADAVRRHGPAHRELGDQPQEQVARGHGRDRRARRRRERRRHRPGRRVRRVVPLPPRRQARRTAHNLLGLHRFKIYGDSRRSGRDAPGAHGVRLRRRRPREGRRRHALRRRRPRSARVGSTRPCR